MEMKLDGTCMIGNGERENGTERIGLILVQTDKERPVNSKDPEWRVGKRINPDDPKTFILWIDSLESARVLQDRINLICLELNGYTVTDA